MVEVTEQAIQAFLIAKLKSVGYSNKKVYETQPFSVLLKILNKDESNVFKAIFGNKIIKRNDFEIEEWKINLRQAQNDVKRHYIRTSIHYICMQIKLGRVYL